MGNLVKKSGFLTLARSRELPKYFTLEEVEQVLSQAGNHRDKLLISMLWQTGLRVGELLSLQREDVDFYSQTLKTKTEKRKGHIRVIPISSALAGELAKWIADKKVADREMLFKLTRFRVHQIVRDVCLKAGIDRKRAHPHTFRHSFAINCVKQGTPVLVLNEWLGHSNVDNTLIYTKILAQEGSVYGAIGLSRDTSFYRIGHISTSFKVSGIFFTFNPPIQN
jgi:integrase/recombinase XerD